MKSRTTRSPFNRYSRKALVDFVEKFAVPHSLIMSNAKAHEILRLLDHSARMERGFNRRAAIDRQLKPLRAKKFLTKQEHKRFISLMREDEAISRRLSRLTIAVEEQDARAGRKVPRRSYEQN
jgi:hypothetical protein